MPPRIRSPTPDSPYSEGSDELDDSPVLPTKPLPTAPRAPAPRSVIRIARAPSTASSSTAAQTAQASDDDLSSLEESQGEEDDGDAFSAGSDEEMDELDELDELEPEPVKPASRAVAAGGVKIKFKLGGAGGAKVVASAPPPRATGGGRKAAAPSASSARKGKGRAKRKTPDEEASDFSENDGFSDASAESSISGTRLTARQRAKEMGGEHGMELQSLPNTVIKGGGKGTSKLTEAEIALRRSEVSRKRKSQSDKRLEDEKTETINRLLKKQVGRQRSKLSSSTTNPNNQSKFDEDGDALAEVVEVVPLVPTRLRWVSSIRSGEYVASLGVPIGMEEWKGETRGYPGPRPPLKTRRLERAVVA